MVPRSRIIALPRDASQEDLKRMLLEEGTRACRCTTARSTTSSATSWRRTSPRWHGSGSSSCSTISSAPSTSSPTAKAVHVLRDLQRRRTQIAVVVDEHGGVAGLLTLEDLVEELVGDIFGETEQPEALWHHEPEGAALVRGDAPIREVNRALSLDLPEGEGYTTVAGLCIALAGAVPERGARLPRQGRDRDRDRRCLAAPREAGPAAPAARPSPRARKGQRG